MDNNHINNGGYPYGQPSSNPYEQPAFANQQTAYAGNQQTNAGQAAYAGSQQTNAGQTAYAGNQQTHAGQTTYAGGQPQHGQQPDTGEKKKKGFHVTLAKTAAIALVFGLVAGLVFTGVSFVGGKAVGVISENTTGSGEAAGGASDNAGDTDSDNGSKGSDSASNAGQTLNQTATGTGVAADLTDVSAIAEEAMPSIVAITNIGTITYQGYFGQSQTYESESCGSGIIISQDDQYIYIATNNHVVSGADTLTVQFVDGTSVNCELQGTDASDDLAVVKVEKGSVEQDTLNQIKVATIGDSESLKVGEATIAIGNALGYGQSVTTGIVSALGRTVTVSDGSYSTITNTNLIQTDAAINPGNSGGALLNAKGEVIGINSAKYSDTSVEGIGYAIPINDAMEIVDQLIQYGEVTSSQTAYLGIQGTDVSSSMSQAYGMPVGVYVYSVISGTGAEAAGIRQGDIITELDGKEITTMNGLKKELENYEAGDVVTLTVERIQNNGYEAQQIAVTLSGESSITQ